MDSEGQNPDFDERRRGGNDFDPSLYNGSGSDSAWGNKMRSDAANGPADGFDDRRENAKDFARFSEEGAAKTGSAAGQNGVGNSPFSSALSNTRDAEKRGGFANNVKGKTLEQAAGAAMPGGKKALAQVKKFGPLGGILAMIATLVMIFAGTQSLAPFGLIANGLDQFNNLRTSMNKRSTYFNRFMLSKDRNVSVTKNATIFTPEKFKVSNSLSKKLQKNGITYVDGDTRFLVYTDPTTGKTYGVAANDNDVGSIPRTAEIPDGNGGMKTVNIDETMKIDDAMMESGNFRSSLDKGTRTMKGHVAGWFDNLSTILHTKRIFNSRDRFKDTSDVASDEEIRGKAMASGMNEDIKPDQVEDEDQVKDKRQKEERGEDGKMHKVYDENGDPVMEDFNTKTDFDAEGVPKDAVRGLDPDSDDVTGRIRNSFEGKTKSMVASIGKVKNVGCTVMKVVSALNVMMSAIQVANILNYVTGFLEAVQRTQAGDAGENELSYYMTRLSEKGNTYSISNDVIEEDKSSLESRAWNQFFSSGSVVIPPDDKIAEKFNREYVGINSIANIANSFDTSTEEYHEIGMDIMHDIQNVLGGTGVAAYKVCLTADMLEAAEGLREDLIDAFGAIATFPAGFIKALVKWAVEKIMEKAMQTAITAAIMSILMASIPYVARVLTRDLISNMQGQDAAYAINSGFNIYLGSQMQMSSGLPATQETLTAHWRMQQEVIASEAEYERSQRSPFDPTSKYTFVGSMINSLIPIANTWSSPLTVMTKTMNTVGAAFSSVLPTAKADGEVRFETSLKRDCPNLSQEDLVGDGFCNAYFVTDPSTMEDDPAEVFEKVAEHDENNFEEADDESGNPPIGEDSNLAKWITSCAARDSQFGIIDNNVMAAVDMINTGNTKVDTIVSTGVGMLPFIGDAVQLRDAIAEYNIVPWATGENCVSEEYKYYSRYSEDQRLMESAGIIEESAVAQYLEKYYEKNPIDNSYEGIIARYSGLTKEQVADTFETIEALETIANYDPTTYGPEEYVEIDDSYQYNSDEKIAEEEIILVRRVVYDDVRMRTKIA